MTAQYMLLQKMVNNLHMFGVFQLIYVIVILLWLLKWLFYFYYMQLRQSITHVQWMIVANYQLLSIGRFDEPYITTIPIYLITHICWLFLNCNYHLACNEV